MKTIKLLPILAILSIFLIASVSAVLPDGEFQDGASSFTLTHGESVGFTARVGTSTKPMVVSVIMYDSESNPVKTFKDSVSINDCFFSEDFTITENEYRNVPAGVTKEFTIEVKGTDSLPETKTYELTLIVNGPNVAPTISSTAPTQIDEDGEYNYQVAAEDANGDILTYTLTGADWLSIDSNGLVTGTAPTVTSDTDYNIEIEVSDGTLSASQTFTLTVKNILHEPTVLISGPEDGRTYNSQINALHFTVLDVDEGETLTKCEYSTDNGQTKTEISSCVLGMMKTVVINSVEGENTWTIYATDSSGETGQSSVTFTVDTSTPDTQAPTIDIVNPRSVEYNRDEIVFEVYGTEDDIAKVEFTLDGGEKIEMNRDHDTHFEYVVTELSEGTHTAVFYATDTSGNVDPQTVVFTVDTIEESADESEKSGEPVVTADPLDETEYFEQYTGQPTINLDDQEQKIEKSFIAKIIDAIINFFKRLFNL